jgi:NinG protein
MSFARTYEEAKANYKPLARRGFRRKAYSKGVEDALSRHSSKLKQRTPLRKVFRRARHTQDGDSAREIKLECDQLIREIIAIRDKKCFTCPATEGLEVGHLFRRGIESLRWSLENNHAQCSLCNFRHEFSPHHYENEFKRHFGVRAWKNLEKRSRQKGKLTYIELSEIRDHLRVVLDTLKTRNEAIA